jgi:hypothetical protein
MKMKNKHLLLNSNEVLSVEETMETADPNRDIPDSRTATPRENHNQMDLHLEFKRASFVNTNFEHLNIEIIKISIMYPP